VRAIFAVASFACNGAAQTDGRPAGQTKPERERERRVRAYKQNQREPVCQSAAKKSCSVLFDFNSPSYNSIHLAHTADHSFFLWLWLGRQTSQTKPRVSAREREAFNMINTLKFYLKLFLKVIRARIFGAPTF